MDIIEASSHQSRCNRKYMNVTGICKDEELFRIITSYSEEACFR